MTTQGYWTEGKIDAGGTNRGGGVFVPGPTTVTAPANPVFDPSLYTPVKTPDQALLDTANTERTAAYGMSSTPSGNDRAAALSMFQGQIDALNQVYAEQKKAETLAGANRLGSNTAIQARRGLLGSDFGAAATDNVNTANADTQRAIDSKHNLDISAVYSAIDKAALDAASNRVTAAQKGADAKIAEIKGRQDAATSAVNSAVKSYFASGNDGTKLTDQNVKEWASKLGVSTDVVVNAIKDAKDLSDKEKRARLKEASDAAFTLSQGQQRYDANGNLIASVAPAANAFNTNNSGLGGGKYNPGENPVVDSWAERIQNGTAKITEIPASQVALRNAVTVALQDMGNSPDGKPTTTELGKAALQTAKSLKAKFDSGTGTSAVGRSGVLGSFGYSLLPGTDRANFVTDFNSLKSQLALEGVKYLKGQGQVSDAERALLAQAVTKLNLAQSEAEFSTTLQGIIDKLEGNSQASVPVPSGFSVVDPNGVSHSFPDQKSLDSFKKAANLP